MKVETISGPAVVADLLEPCDVEEFLGGVVGTTFRHITGRRGRFTALFPWTTLNAILAEHRLDPPRIRVIDKSSMVSPGSYLRHHRSYRGERSSINPVELHRLFARGATVIIDAVEEMVPSITRLAENLERTLHERVQVNAYIDSGASVPDREPHVDYCDVMVLQISGRKRWRIYGDSNAGGTGTRRNGRTPPSEPISDCLLEEGDILYFPMGWWHDARPVGEPTLHLSVAWTNRTGASFFQWLQEELSARPIFQRPLPRFATTAERAQHAQELRAELDFLWEDDVLDRYLQVEDGCAMPRPQFNLPIGASITATEPGDDTFVRFTAPRPVTVRHSAEHQEIEFWANGERWEFARRAEAVLAPLLTGESHSIGELTRLAQPTFSRERIRQFLGELLAQGLVAVVPAD